MLIIEFFPVDSIPIISLKQLDRSMMVILVVGSSLNDASLDWNFENHFRTGVIYDNLVINATHSLRCFCRVFVVIKFQQNPMAILGAEDHRINYITHYFLAEIKMSYKIFFQPSNFRLCCLRHLKFKMWCKILLQKKGKSLWHKTIYISISTCIIIFLKSNFKHAFP